MINLTDANVIKAQLIDYLTNNGLIKNSLLGSELFCGTKKRQTDLLIVNEYTTVIEIKSKNDDFRRLREQLNDYKKIFDYQYIVTTNSHIKKAFPILEDNEGIIIIDEEGKFKLERKARKIYNHDKIEILETIPLSFLKKNCKNIKITNTDMGIRGDFKKKSVEELKFLLKEFLKERLQVRNETFCKERGFVTHFEDIRVLSSRMAAEITI